MAIKNHWMDRRVWCCAHIYINLFFIFIHKLSKHTDRPTFDAHKKSNHDNETFCSFFNVFAKSLTVICTTYIHTYIMLHNYLGFCKNHAHTYLHLYTHAHKLWPKACIYAVEMVRCHFFGIFTPIIFIYKHSLY